MKHPLKQLLVSMLALSMIVPVIQIPVFAETEPAATELEAERISPEKLPDGNLLYFGSASAVLSEKDAVYSVPVYREGNIDSEASVEIHSIDVTAVYGKDYEILSDDIQITGGKKSILEYYSTTDEVPETSEVSQPPIWENIDELSRLDSFLAEDQPASEQTDSDYIPLAKRKEAITGQPTRKLHDTKTQNFVNSVMEETIPDVMNELDYSSSLKLCFAPGESEKLVKFRIIDDDESEGTEGFSLLLTNAQNSEVYNVTSLSVLIEDDEPAEHSVISFTKSKYRSHNGKAVLTVKRSGAEYSLADMTVTTCGDTAEAGNNYTEINETLTFMPYETEKEIEIPVSGKGEFDVLLSDLKGCDEGAYAKTTVAINEKDDLPLLTADEDYSFGIKIKDKDYTVRYTPGTAKGKIMDESYAPALQVGEFYFPSTPGRNGIFTYGHCDGAKPWGCGFRHSEYIHKSNTDMSQNYGKLEYYHTSTWKNGRTWTESSEIPATYYQYITPYWESTSEAFGGQKSSFRLEALNTSQSWDASATVSGKFSRTLDNASVTIGKNGTNHHSDSTIKMYAYAVDNESNKTPKIKTNFYGAAAMFKQYTVKMTAPDGKTYKTPTGETNPLPPAQVTLKCGAQLLYENESRAIYANPNDSDSNLIFSAGNSHVNGRDGKFGSIIGYNITIGPAGNTQSASYPTDFINFLNSKKDSSSGCIDYSGNAVGNEINKINKNLDTIPYDKYFIDWIESVQTKTTDYKLGYKQDISFKPIFQYNDVKITVLPSSGGEGNFTDSQLKSGSTLTYHAGDLLELSAKAEDETNNYAAGYEVSTDGGVSFDFITSTSTLFLESFKSYMIRPIIAKKNNRIEVHFANDEAEKNLEIIDAIPQNELESDAQLKGLTILNLNPQKTTALEKMTPTVGKDYAVRIKVTGTPSDSSCVYRPVITDRMTNKSYNTQSYYMNARSQLSDNIIDVSIETVKKSDLKTFNLKGNIASEFTPIRSAGLELKTLPVSGYTVITGNGQDSSGTVTDISSQTDADGAYSFMDIEAKEGDTLPLLISNGLTNGQITEVTLSDSKEDSSVCTANAGLSKISYPTGIPKVTDITYSYDKAQNNQSHDNTQNSVNIFDDSINITAQVDLNGRIISKAIFTVYTTTGVKTEYIADSDPSDLGKFTVTILKMTENLHNGDRISVKLVDNEKRTISLGSKTAVLDIDYPDVDTGLVFYTENVLLRPQTFDLDKSPAVNIPVLGASSGKASSGLLAFSRTNWNNNTGYTIDINITGISSNMGASTADKQKALSKYKNAVQTDHEVDRLTAENIAYSTALEDMEQDDPDFTNLRDSIHANEATLNTLGRDHAKNSLMGMSKDTTMSITASFMLELDFIYNPEKKEYMFCFMGVTIGGTFSFNKSFYTMISYVPCFFNLNGTLQGNLIVSHVSSAAHDAVTANEFDSYSGNIAEVFADDSVNWTLSLMGKLTGQVGVGICGVLSARGYMSLQLQFDVVLHGNKPGGGLFGTTGGIGFDLLFVTLNIDLVSATVGWGSLEGKTSVSYFGGLLNTPILSSQGNTSAEQNTAVYSSDDNMIFSVKPASPGTSDMSMFGKYDDGLLNAAPQAVSMSTILSPAAERTRPHIIPLKNGKKMITFIGNSSDELNQYALYYSIYDGSWSTPQLVDNDSTVDFSPAVLNLGDKVIIAWSDADRQLSETDSVKDKLNALNISLAVYDANTNTMSEEFMLIDNEYPNLSPMLTVSGDNIYCTYMQRDLYNAKNDNDLLNIEGLYSTMSYVKYNMTSHQVTPEQPIVIKHPRLQDPLVTDYCSQAISIGGEDYMLYSYTIDEDEDLTTGDERTLWLGLKNLTSDHEYYPIELVSKSENAVAPKLTKIGDTVYLTYIKNGSVFNILDAGQLISDLFTSSEAGTIYRDSSTDDIDWYKKSASDLSMDDSVYSGSIFDKIANGKFADDETNFNRAEGNNTVTSDYVITDNGDDIYIFYTDISSKDNGTFTTGRELYGLRYKRYDSDNPLCGNDESSGFTKAAQITDYNMVIDELDLYMTTDNKISAVSNFYEQSIDSDGKMQYSDNSLVELDFVPSNSLGLKNDKISIPARLICGDTAQLELDVINNGLLTTTGYDIRITELCGSTETEIFNDSIPAVLDTGETDHITAKWTVPNNVSNTKIRVYLTEHDTMSAEALAAEQTINCESTLSISGSEIVWKGNQPYIKTSICNIGSKPSEASLGKIYASDSSGNESKIYSEFDIPALASGESKDFEIAIKLSANDFSEFGMIDIIISAISGDKEEKDFLKISSSTPIISEINNGDEALTIKKNNTSKLSSVAAPWNSIAGDAAYYSEDPDIASVTSDGIVTANKTGSVLIHAYYPISGISDSITVNVTDSGSGGGRGSSSAQKYTVTFQTNGGSSINPITAEKGKTITAPPSPIKTGYSFDGWYSDQNLVNTYDFEQPITQNITLYARWKQDCIKPEYKNPFNDVKAADWFFDAVKYVNENGIMTGTEDTVFEPHSPITRGMFVTVLHRAESTPAASASPFKDVDPSAYYSKAIDWAFENGIVDGISDSEFAPDVTITRQQAAAILYRYANLKNYDTSADENTNILSYKDFDEISEYAIPALCWAVGNGIMSGKSDSTLNPRDTASRAEAAAILMRFMESAK